MLRSLMGRKSILFVALALTLMASFWGGDDDEIAEPVERPASSAPRDTPRQSQNAPAPLALHRELLQREAADLEIDNIFAARSWYVPPPPPKPTRPLPPPPPTAPPMPFAYIGKLEEEGRTMIFLSRQGVNYSVKQGDQIEGTYRVEEISPHAVILTYLPLNIRQTLPIGAHN